MSLWCIPSTETILGYPHPSTSSANHAACILTFSLSLSVRSLSTLWWLNACMNGKRSPVLCQLLSSSFVQPSLSVLPVIRLSECMLGARRGNKTPCRHGEKCPNAWLYGQLSAWFSLQHNVVAQTNLRATQGPFRGSLWWSCESCKYLTLHATTSFAFLNKSLDLAAMAMVSCQSKVRKFFQMRWTMTVAYMGQGGQHDMEYSCKI